MAHGKDTHVLKHKKRYTNVPKKVKFNEKVAYSSKPGGKFAQIKNSYE
jgi:hypothetical protein